MTAYDVPPVVPAPPAGPDATEQFAAKLADPNRWVVRPGVPVFKAHERSDPATGQLIRVDLPKLYRIAANMNRLERDGGVPIRMTLGHTEPGKPETEQPPVGGYYKNARVQQFGPNGEPAIVVDEWLDPQYQGVRKNYPYRSSEYYDDAEQITGVALLTRDPYLDLGVVAYDRGDGGPVCYTRSAPASHRVDYARATGRNPVLYQLVLGDAPMFDQTGQPVPQWAGQPSPGAVPQGPPPGQYAPAPPPAQVPYQGAPQSPPAAAAQGHQTNYRQTPYQGGWPGPAYHPHKLTSHLHSSKWNYGARPSPYGIMDGLTGAASGATLGGMVGGPIGAVGGGLVGGGLGLFAGQEPQPTRAARYGAPQRPRGGPRRYAGEEMMGGPPPMGPADGGAQGPGDPMQKLQMLLMAAVDVLGELTGQGQPPEPPAGPFPGEGPTPADEGQYSRYSARPQGRTPRRYSTEAQPVNYNDPRRPAPQQPLRTLSGRPVGEGMQIAALNYQLQQQGQALKMLAYERDQADTQACIAEVQNLANQGYPVTDYEVTELKAKPREHRGAYLQHIMTKYAKVGTEALPPIAGDPTPAGADPRLAAPTSKEEMEAALRLMGNSNDPTAYGRALEQVRYARAGGQPQPFPAAPGAAQYPPAGYPQGPADGYPQGFVPQSPYGA